MNYTGSYIFMAVDERFPSASHKSQAKTPRPEQKNDPVVTSGVKKQKKTGLEKAASNFLADDVRDVKSYVVNDIIKPRLRHIFVDSICNAASMLILGEEWNGTTSNRRPGTRFNYNGISSNQNNSRTNLRPARQSTYDWENLAFYDDEEGSGHSKAELVLEQMCDRLDNCGNVSIGEMYDFSKMQTLQTDFDWGWTNLGGTQLRRTTDGGWYIDLPRPVSLR